MAMGFLIGAGLKSIGQIVGGFQENQQAQVNAQIYEAQAKNIEAQRSIVASQYRTKAEVLEGKAVTTSARNGVKISGSTALSISQSLEQLMLDESYQQYNLKIEKQKALDNARLQKYKGQQAIFQGLVGGTSTLLTAGQDYANKYWKNNKKQNLLSGGFDISNQAVLEQNTIV